MSSFITVLSVPYLQQVHIIKSRLESEGIECFIKDELTIQTDPLLSNAIGGIKLQVQEKDLERAVEILEAEGYLKNPNEAEINPYEKFRIFADKLPFFKKVRFEVRLLFLLFIVITSIYLLIYFITS